MAFPENAAFSFTEGQKAFDAGSFAVAEQAFRQAIVLLGKKPDCLADRLKVLNSLGHILVVQKKLDSALVVFQEAAETAETLGERIKLAWQQANIGSIHRDLEQYDQARPYYQKALELFSQLSDTEGTAAQYANLGYLCTMTGDDAKALDWFQQASRAFTFLGHHEQAALAERNISVLQHRLKNDQAQGRTP